MMPREPRQNVMDIIWDERDSQVENLLGQADVPLFEWLNFIDEHLLRARRAASVHEATDEVRNLAACAVAVMQFYGGRTRAAQMFAQSNGSPESISSLTLSEAQFPIKKLSELMKTAGDEPNRRPCPYEDDEDGS